MDFLTVGHGQGNQRGGKEQRPCANERDALLGFFLAPQGRTNKAVGVSPRNRIALNAQPRRGERSVPKGCFIKLDVILT